MVGICVPARLKGLEKISSFLGCYFKDNRISSS